MYNTATGAAKARSYDGDYMAAGKWGEALVLKWLRSRYYVLDVDDYRALKPMRKADVDFGIYLHDGRVLLAEVKTDRHLGVTGNVLFEMLRINHTARPDKALVLGWSQRSPATWLLYVAPAVRQIWQIRFSDFRAGLQEYTGKTRKGTRLDYVETDKIKSTVNVLVPESFIPKIHKHDISNLFA